MSTAISCDEKSKFQISLSLLIVKRTRLFESNECEKEVRIEIWYSVIPCLKHPCNRFQTSTLSPMLHIKKM